MSTTGSSSKRPSVEPLRFGVFDGSVSIADVVVLVERAHRESRFADIPFAPDKVNALADRVLRDPARHGMLLCWKGDTLVGFLYCSIGEFFIGTETLMTTVHTIFTRPENRRGLNAGRAALGLIKGVESWSAARRASEILFHVTSDVSVPRSHKLLKRLGYKFIGGSYAKPVV